MGRTAQTWCRKQRGDEGGGSCLGGSKTGLWSVDCFGNYPAAKLTARSTVPYGTNIALESAPAQKTQGLSGRSW